MRDGFGGSGEGQKRTEREEVEEESVQGWREMVVQKGRCALEGSSQKENGAEFATHQMDSVDERGATQNRTGNEGKEQVFAGARG